MSSSGCSYEDLLNQTRDFHPVVSPTQASNDANSSSAYSSWSETLGPNVTIRYDGAGVTGTGSSTLCTTSFEYYLVAYALNYTNASINSSQYRTGQLSILINSSSGLVHNSSVMRLPDYTTHYSTTNWAGYAVSKCSDCSVWLSYAQ